VSVCVSQTYKIDHLGAAGKFSFSNKQSLFTLRQPDACVVNKQNVHEHNCRKFQIHLKKRSVEQIINRALV
jgi:hypothetical protein